MLFNLKSAYLLYHTIVSSVYFSAQEEDYYTTNYYEYFATKFSCFHDALSSLGRQHQRFARFAFSEYVQGFRSLVLYENYSLFERKL